MNLKMTLLSIFAILCVLGSACAVSAADDYGTDGYVGVDNSYDDTYLGDDADTTYDDDYGYDDDTYDWTYPGDLEPGNGLPLENQTNVLGNATGNSTGNATHAAGEPVNHTANATSNITAGATSAHTLPATGNPVVLLLLAVAAVGAGCLKKKID